MAGGADKGGAAAGSSSNSARAAEQQAKQSISHYISKLRQGDTAKWEKVSFAHEQASECASTAVGGVGEV